MTTKQQQLDFISNRCFVEDGKDIEKIFNKNFNNLNEMEGFIVKTLIEWRICFGWDKRSETFWTSEWYSIDLSSKSLFKFFLNVACVLDKYSPEMPKEEKGFVFLKKDFKGISVNGDIPTIYTFPRGDVAIENLIKSHGWKEVKITEVES